jgi:RNA polymerase sigma-70 factor, ECF subfamily
MPHDRVPVIAAAARTDSDLLTEIRASDPVAFDEAMRRHWTPLLRYADGLAPDGDAAEDAVQEAFVRLWERRRKWRTSDSLRALLFRIVRNDLLNRRRARKSRDRLVARLTRLPHRRPATPVQLAEQGDLSAAVERALAALPERRREVFVLIRHSGLSYREAAGVMGVSPQTVANQMSAALATLREQLAPYLETENSEPLRFPRGRRIG